MLRGDRSHYENHMLVYPDRLPPNSAEQPGHESILPSFSATTILYCHSAVLLMIDHILGRPNPSWKRAQVRRLPMI